MIVGAGLGGSTVNGELMTAPDAIQEVYSALEAMNGKEIFEMVRGSQFLEPFTREVYGGNGYTEKHKEIEVYGRKGGDKDYRNTINKKEVVKTKTYNTDATTVGDVDFTQAMVERAQRTPGVALSDLVEPKMMAIARWYVTRYLPYSPYISLLDKPTDGGDFWNENGMLLNTVVPERYLKPGRDTTRNHWMSVAQSTGVEAEDISAAIERLTDYVDTFEGDVVIYGSTNTLAKMQSIYNEPANKDTFWRTGEPMTVIREAKFIANDLLPKDFLLFVNGGADFLLTKNMEPLPEFRGMATFREDGRKLYEDEADLIGSKFKVYPEAWYMDGRTDAVIMDINESRWNADREMQAGGFTAIDTYRDSLLARIDDTYRR